MRFLKYFRTHRLIDGAIFKTNKGNIYLVLKISEHEQVINSEYKAIKVDLPEEELCGKTIKAWYKSIQRSNEAPKIYTIPVSNVAEYGTYYLDFREVGNLKCLIK